MDPLSVGASIVGLLAAGGKVTAYLFSLVSRVEGAPSLAQSLLWEVADISAALGHIRRYAFGKQFIPTDRGALILLEHVLASLTGCVTTYSDLQAILDGLRQYGLQVDPEIGLFDRVRWTHQEASLNNILQRLQNHRSSLMLILRILQCESTDEAQSSAQTLCELFEDLLRSDPELASRIRGLKSQGSALTLRSAPSTRQWDVRLSTRTSRSSRLSTYLGDAMYSIRLAFDRDLDEPRKDKRASGPERQSMYSVASTALERTGLSIFWKVSISDISRISAYALPIFANDLKNCECYVFGEGTIFDLQSSHSSTQTPSTPPATPLNEVRGIMKQDIYMKSSSFNVTPPGSSREGHVRAGEAVVIVASSERPEPQWFAVKSINRDSGVVRVPVSSLWKIGNDDAIMPESSLWQLGTESA